MSKKISIPRGTKDILPADILSWQELERKTRRILEIYGYGEIRTPIFEETGLFKRTLGQTSEVVVKQLLELSKQKEDGFALRPEGTASIVRSYIENSMDRKENLSKLYYIGPMFRGERPQKGRLRQFHQVGVEVIGPDSSLPYLDSEVIALSVNILKELGLKGFQLKINTLGTVKDKENFAKWLRQRLKKDISKLNKNLQKSFNENVFRILDSKEKECRELVKKLNFDQSYLSAESKKYFTKVKEGLKILNIDFEEVPSLVRGLDYYTQTVFEICDSSLGSQDALGAGGRYNKLVSQLGGPSVDAIGFALGIERILLTTKEIQQTASPIDVFIIAMDEAGYSKAFGLLNELRSKEVVSDMNYRMASMKSQMRQANKSGCRYVVIIGEEEVKNGTVTIKNMEKGLQTQEKMDDINKIVSRLKER